MPAHQHSLFQPLFQSEQETEVPEIDWNNPAVLEVHEKAGPEKEEEEEEEFFDAQE